MLDQKLVYINKVRKIQKMKGIILDKTFSQELIKPKSSLVTDNLYNEILVSLLLHEKAYLPSEF